MVKISSILPWKYWVIFVSSWLEREVSGKFPSTFCGQWNKKALTNSLGTAVTFYITIKIRFFLILKKSDLRELTIYTCTFIITIWKEILQKLMRHVNLFFQVIVFAVTFKWNESEKIHCTVVGAIWFKL